MLDFDGHSVNSTSAWGAFDAQPYDPDGNGVEFTAGEQAAIALVWAQVAEDYAPFDIDVTTEPFDTQDVTTVHAVITESTQVDGSDMPHPNGGGVAYVGVFGEWYFPAYYSPALGKKAGRVKRGGNRQQREEDKKEERGEGGEAERHKAERETDRQKGGKGIKEKRERDAVNCQLFLS